MQKRVPPFFPAIVLFPLMMENENENATEIVRNITVCLLATAAAGMLITIYHCITRNNVRDILNERRATTTTNHLHPHQHQTSSMPHQDHQRNIETSIAQLIPSYKYQKKGDDVDNKGVLENDDGICPVCLSDFEDGEEVRKLPDCLHCFHAPCIDLWLFSHPNCPLCRTIATCSPRMLLHLINSIPNTPPIAANMHHNYISPIDRLV